MKKIEQSSMYNGPVTVLHLADGTAILDQGPDNIVVALENRITLCRALLPDGYELREKEVQNEQY